MTSRSNPAAALGEIIRRQRELNELSMRQFADMAGISNPYLSQIERGLRAPSDRVMDAIAHALETSTDSLYEKAGLQAEEAEEESPVVEAIRSDDRLTARQRQALLSSYEAFVAMNGEPSSRRRRRRGG